MRVRAGMIRFRAGMIRFRAGMIRFRAGMIRFRAGMIRVRAGSYPRNPNRDRFGNCLLQAEAGGRHGAPAGRQGGIPDRHGKKAA